MNRFILVSIFSLWFLSNGFSQENIKKDSISPILHNTIKEHPRLKALRSELNKTEQDLKIQKGGWFPNLVLSGDSTRQFNTGNNVNQKSFDSYHLSAGLTQKIYDFGKTNREINQQLILYKQAQAELFRGEENLIRSTLDAYLDYSYAQKSLGHALKSQLNIRKQVDLEEKRVKGGQGFSTDVLQAKTQLSAAKSRSIQAKNALKVFENRLKVFLNEKDLKNIQSNPHYIPYLKVPKLLDQALSVSQKENPEINLAQLDVQLSENQLKLVRSSAFAPSIEAQANGLYGRNINGRLGVDEESQISINFQLPFNTKGTAFNQLKAAKASIASSQHRKGDSKRLVEELVRNAWENLKTTQENSKILAEQAKISENFLELARKERSLGRRSLIDVLNGELAWIQARSQQENAERDATKARIHLLHAMGKLNSTLSLK